MEDLDPELQAKMAQAVNLVMDLDPENPLAVLLSEVVEELVSRTDDPVLLQAFPNLANHLPPDFFPAPVAQIIPNGYAASVGVPGMEYCFYGEFDSLSYFEMDKTDLPDVVGDTPYQVHAQYHRLARLVILLVSIPTEDTLNLSRATRLRSYILSGLQDIAVAARQGYAMSIPRPFVLWLSEEIRNLSVSFDDDKDHWEVICSNEMIHSQICHLNKLIDDPGYGWKLHCCREVMSFLPAELVDELLTILLSGTQEQKLQDAYRSLASELPADFDPPILFLFPKGFAVELGFPDMGRPFYYYNISCRQTPRRSHAAEPCSPYCTQGMYYDISRHMDRKDNREVYTVQACYHRIARLIMLLQASLTTPSADNGRIAARLRLKDGIYELLRSCVITYSLRCGDCMEIPFQIEDWVERDIKKSTAKLKSVERGIEELKAVLKSVKRDINASKALLKSMKRDTEESTAKLKSVECDIEELKAKAMEATGRNTVKEAERKRLLEAIEDHEQMIHGTVDYI